MSNTDNRIVGVDMAWGTLLVGANSEATLEISQQVSPKSRIKTTK